MGFGQIGFGALAEKDPRGIFTHGGGEYRRKRGDGKGSKQAKMQEPFRRTGRWEK